MRTRTLLAGLTIPLQFAVLSAAPWGLGVQTATATEVAVDFLAVDKAGQPVTDLRADEIRVRLGRSEAQPLNLRLLRVAADPPSGAVPRFLDADAEGFERRVLVAIDDESVAQGSEQSTKSTVLNLLRGLGVADEIGVFLVPRTRTSVGFTTDRFRASQAVQRFSGRAPRLESADDAACRAKQVLSDLADLLEMAQHPDGPLVVVFVSGGMQGTAAGQGPSRSPRACDIDASEFQQLGLVAARARSYFYVVQPESFARTDGQPSPRVGLEHLAGVTGGRLIQLSGRDRETLEPVLIETSAQYVAFVSRGRNASPVVPLDVRTSRRGVRIVARPQLIMPGERR